MTHSRTSAHLRIAVTLLVACMGASAAVAYATEPSPGTPPGINLPPTSEPVPPPPPWDGVAYKRGVVSASHPLAAQAGAAMLARGGNAVDAAAAVQFMLGVVEPQFTGLGGGGFVMIHLARQHRTLALDARETAPAAATPTQFQFTAVAPADRFAVTSTTGLSVGVPGVPELYDVALRRWGTMSLAQVMAPAIRVAERGFKVNRFLAANINNDFGRTQLQPETAALFRPGGVPLKEGDLLVQRDLARTLRLIAQQGPRAFYKGDIAKAIVAAQARSRTPVPAEGAGRMTLQDLAAYRVVVREPLSVNYRGWQVASMPPPSSGALTVGQMLKMVERFPIGDVQQGYGFGSPKTLHVMGEAMRLAYADRAVWMGDEDFVPVPKAGLLNAGYVAGRSALIDPASRMATPAAGYPWAHDKGDRPIRMAVIEGETNHPSHTTHYTVVDAAGNVVSATTTIESLWGSGILVPGYGFLLNNELTDFNLDPTRDTTTGNPGANDVAPGKRPRSSMAPTLVFKGDKPVLAYGSPGGATIINTVFNTTLNLVDHGMSVQQAINAPRFSITSPAGTVACEGTEPFMQPKFSVTTQDALRSLGHLLPGAAGGNGCTAAIGSVQALVIDLGKGLRYGGADARREGTVIGLGARQRHAGPEGDAAVPAPLQVSRDFDFDIDSAGRAHERRSLSRDFDFDIAQ